MSATDPSVVAVSTRTLREMEALARTLHDCSVGERHKIANQLVAFLAEAAAGPACTQSEARQPRPRSDHRLIVNTGARVRNFKNLTMDEVVAIAASEPDAVCTCTLDGKIVLIPVPA